MISFKLQGLAYFTTRSWELALAPLWSVAEYAFICGGFILRKRQRKQGLAQVMSERVTITLKKGFLREIDRAVDRVKVRSRSHLIEVAMREYLDKRTSVQPDPLEKWLDTIVDGRRSDALKEHDLVA